ncbi:hypothetical protein A9404_12395 [Halothiobacillus diazotrophicus]|uniref:NADP-dependent oxidoreductase domain-containing protein n=1 Tax=Halothiobacillus diazotrophicus TaxID=1860122 RepID=A0A191ZJP3_9GAMM|nr:aldo/keto reductase [Halothiobacillus diazotrophicus]ANJ68067.1 hypothetical protein A9404_12395 [Halothiobacillus diazotrophicus]
MNHHEAPMLGGRRLNRMGFGAMRLPGVRDVPENTERARSILRRAVALGATLIDTADFYGSGLANRSISEALSPYPEDLIIATKVGVKAGAGGRPESAATPDEIRASVARNLETLGVERLDLVFLRLAGGPLADSGVPIETSLGCLAELQAQGLVGHVGLSSASMTDIERANAVVPIEAVQNAYFIGHTDSRDVLAWCDSVGIPFLAYFPLGMGKLPKHDAALQRIATARGATAAQIALAWLLALSPMMVPIPGTADLAHLEENMDAVLLDLSGDEVAQLNAVGD